MSNVKLIIGPPVQNMSRTAATQALLQHPDLPANADYTIIEDRGRWIAAFADVDGLIKDRKAAKKAAKSKKQAGDFPGEGGGEADASEESPAPKSEGPDDSEPSEGGESSGDGGESKPPKEHGEHGKEHGGGGLEAVLPLLQAIADALGVSPMGADSGPIPGADPMGAGGPPAPPMGPGAGGHAGPPAPPHGGPGGPGAGPMGPGGNQHVMHEKSGPPMPPTFASSHPWAHTVGRVSHFRVAEEIGEQDLASVESELQQLASAGGFEVKQARPERGEDGKMYLAAIIKAPAAQA